MVLGQPNYPASHPFSNAAPAEVSAESVSSQDCPFSSATSVAVLKGKNSRWPQKARNRTGEEADHEGQERKKGDPLRHWESPLIIRTAVLAVTPQQKHC